jgi:hypothetical protein
VVSIATPQLWCDMRAELAEAEDVALRRAQGTYMKHFNVKEARDRNI